MLTLHIFCIITLSQHISSVEIYNNTHFKVFFWVAWEKKETRENRWYRLFPVDWGVSEKLIIFLVARRGSKGRKMPRGHWYLSIYLSLFLPRQLICLCISPHVLPYSFWPFIIFLCPTAFWLLSCSFVFLSCSFLLYFAISCPTVLSNRPLGFLSVSGVSYSNHLKSFITPSSHLPVTLAFPWAGLDGYSTGYAMVISRGIRAV